MTDITPMLQTKHLEIFQHHPRNSDKNCKRKEKKEAQISNGHRDEKPVKHISSKQAKTLRINSVRYANLNQPVLYTKFTCKHI